VRPTSFQASLLKGLVPLVLVTAGAVYALDAWREHRTKEELSQRIVRRGAELVAERFDQILSEARLGAGLLATSGPSGDLPGLVERIAATPVNTAPSRDALAAAALANSRIVAYLRNRPNAGAASVASERGVAFLVLQQEGDRFRNRIVNREAWGARALWLEADSQGRPVASTWEDSDYDARARPWFALTGVPANEPRWTEPMVMAATGELGMTASAWWMRDGIRWVGALDLLLLDVTRFTQHRATSADGALAAAFTSDWRAIGLPRDERFSTAQQQRAALLHPVDRLGSPALVAALRSVEPIDLGQVKAFRLEVGGVAWWTGVVRYPVPGTKGFLVVVAVPDRNLLLGIADIRAALLAATLAALALAVAISFWLARLFARPIAQLSAQSRRLEALDFGDIAVPPTAVREIHELAEAQQRALRAVESFSRYVPVGVVRELVRRGEVARIGGGTRPLVALFTDIAGFTAVAERLGPAISALHLAQYFEVLIEAIETRDGTVDKFMGDGVFAFWGAPAEVPDAARRAVEAVIAIREGIARREPEWLARGMPALPTRFGLDSGPSIVGNMGAQRRLAYTAIGDPINLASRLEGANKAYGTSVLAGPSLPIEAGAGFVWRRVDRMRVLGRNEPVFAYELVGRTGDVDAATLEYIRDYEAAWDLYAARDFESASRAFAALPQRHPHDKAASVLLATCRELAAQVPRHDWAPVTELTVK
jgi:adenylate cyclase